MTAVTILFPACAPVYLSNKGSYLIAARNWREARAFYLKAIDDCLSAPLPACDDRRQANLYFDLAHVYAQSGDYRAAIPYAAKSFRLAPGIDIRDRLALYVERSLRSDEATAMWNLTDAEIAAHVDAVLREQVRQLEQERKGHLH